MLHRPEVTGARAQVLKVLATLPGIALLSPQEAALYINTTPDVLRVWRSQVKGPRYKGRGHFVRYQKSDLDGFMSGFDHRFDTPEIRSSQQEVLSVTTPRNAAISQSR
jgi:hypothetical protein